VNKKTIFVSVFLIAFILINFLGNAQIIPTVEAKDRVILKKTDTVYQFYAVKAPKKFKLQNHTKYFWYAADTILVTENGFSGRILHGAYSVHYPNNNLREQGYFRYGLKNDQWKMWYPNGTLEKLSNWKNGQLNGSFIEYNESGKKIREGNYKNDLLNGNLTIYSSDGKSSQVLYRNGIKAEPKVEQPSKTDSTSSAPKTK
jgi:antitoxin component YwqK of YwqJK toxin-antitoxin module